MATQALTFGARITAFPQPGQFAEAGAALDQLFPQRRGDEATPVGLPCSQRCFGELKQGLKPCRVLAALQQLCLRQSHDSLKRTTCSGRAACTAVQGSSMLPGVSTSNNQRPSW